VGRSSSAATAPLRIVGTETKVVADSLDALRNQLASRASSAKRG
jgi:hypothetical protein